MVMASAGPAGSYLRWNDTLDCQSQPIASPASFMPSQLRSARAGGAALGGAFGRAGGTGDVSAQRAPRAHWQSAAHMTAGPSRSTVAPTVDATKVWLKFQVGASRPSATAMPVNGTAFGNSVMSAGGRAGAQSGLRNR